MCGSASATARPSLCEAACVALERYLKATELHDVQLGKRDRAPELMRGSLRGA